MNPEQTEIVHILKCLIRISRHSYEAALAIVSCPGLLESVQSLCKYQYGFYFCFDFFKLELF